MALSSRIKSNVRGHYVLLRSFYIGEELWVQFKLREVHINVI